MHERRPGQQTSPEEPKGNDSIVKFLATSGAIGSLFGTPAYVIARVLANEDTAIRWGFGFGVGAAAAATGVGLSNRSMERAEEYLKEGRTKRARIEVARGTIEDVVGFGVAGSMPGVASGNTTQTAALGAALGGISAHLNYRERIKPFPELTIPEGNSVVRDASFPESIEGMQYPPVFRANSLKDALEFRDVNKERIIKWASYIPNRSGDSNSLGVPRIVNSIFIIPNIQHYQAYDPKESKDMQLQDPNERNGIIVHPDKHSFLVWPYQSVFESRIGESTFFHPRIWQHFRDRSWKGAVVLLFQYQTSDWAKLNTNTVSDNYWLLDIHSNDPGIRRRIRQPVPQGRPSPVLVPQQT